MGPPLYYLRSPRTLLTCQKMQGNSSQYGLGCYGTAMEHFFLALPTHARPRHPCVTTDIVAVHVSANYSLHVYRYTHVYLEAVFSRSRACSRGAWTTYGFAPVFLTLECVSVTLIQDMRRGRSPQLERSEREPPFGFVPWVVSL